MLRAGERSTRLLLLIAAAATLVAVIRVGSHGMQVLWAEDGALFLQDADRFGVSVALRPYAGYEHLLPRLAAALVVLLPVDRFAIGINLLCCLLTGVAAALTYQWSAAITPRVIVRATLAAAVVLVPSAPIEVLGSVANLHSYCLWLVPFLLLARPMTWLGAAAQGVLALVLALTEIQTVLFAPFGLIGWRDRRNWPKLAGFALGLAGQAAATLSAGRRAMPGADEASGAAMVAGYWVNAFLSLISAQSHQLRNLVMATGWAPIGLAFLVLLAGLVVAARVALPAARAAILMLCFGSMATFALGYLVSPFPDYRHFRDPGAFHDALLRYAAIASLFLVGAIIVAAGEALRVGRWRLGAAVLAAVWLAFLVNLHQARTTRSFAPVWSASVEEGAALCRAEPTRQWATAPVWPPGPRAEFSCAKLLEHRP